MKIIDKMNKINDEYIETVLKIDNKQKLMGEKMKENKRPSIWKQIIVPAICIISIVIIGTGYVYMNNLKQTKIVKTNDKYLTANYSMLLYKESDNYIKENINLEELEENKTITIKSEEILDKEEEPEEYQYCSGKIVIKKTKNGFYEHTIESSCENEADKNVNLTMKVYTNVNKNQKNNIVLTNIVETKDGYRGTLANYDFESGTDLNGNSYNTYNYNGVSGIINLDKDLNIKNINLLDKAKTGVNTELYYLNNNYIVSEYTGENDSTKLINYYDKDLKLIWQKEMPSPSAKFLYESDTKLVFVDNYSIDVKGKFIIINKTDGSLEETKEIDNISLIDLKYDNGYLFGFDRTNTYKIYKYDLDGKIISTINLLDIEGIEHTNSFTGSALSNNVSLYKNKDSIYVFDKDGKLINKIATTIDNKYEIESYSVSTNYYELIYDNNSKMYRYSEDGDKELIQGNQKRYIKYDLNNNIITSADIDETYGYKQLNNMGLELDATRKDSRIMDSKLFEYIYSSENKGTMIIMLYDYSKINNSIITNTVDNNE